MSSEFQTASAAAENAHEEKILLACGRCRSGAEAERECNQQHLIVLMLKYHAVNLF